MDDPRVIAYYCKCIFTNAIYIDVVFPITWHITDQLFPFHWKYKLFRKSDSCIRLFQSLKTMLSPTSFMDKLSIIR